MKRQDKITAIARNAWKVFSKTFTCVPKFLFKIVLYTCSLERILLITVCDKVLYFALVQIALQIKDFHAVTLFLVTRLRRYVLRITLFTNTPFEVISQKRTEIESKLVV